jgi:hypothetical protein
MGAPCIPAGQHPGQAIVLGMSRSGSSLTTSIVAQLLCGGTVGDAAWRGGGAPLATDSANVHGYFERRDVVQLNYATVGQTGYNWHIFPPSFSSAPTALSPSPEKSIRSKSFASMFRKTAERIVTDMHASARKCPWVLKDVRFARTLPLWWSHLKGPTACIIPYRHPSEVSQSSKMRMTDRVRLWQNYMLSALATARSLRCPTYLVSYERWLHLSNASRVSSASGQMDELLQFLRCAGLRNLANEASHAALRKLVRQDAHHHHTSPNPALPPSVLCLWNALESGEALSWTWDDTRQTFARLPCRD